MIPEDYYNVVGFLVLPILWIVAVGATGGIVSSTGASQVWVLIVAVVGLVLCYRAYNDGRVYLLDAGILRPVQPQGDKQRAPSDREDDPRHGRNVRQAMRDIGALELENVTDEMLFKAMGHDPKLANPTTPTEEAEHEQIKKKAERVQQNLTSYPEIEDRLRELREDRKIDFKWKEFPPPGEATADDPAVLLVEKRMDVSERKLRKPEFWGQLQGVRRLIDVDTYEYNDQYYALYLSDEETSLPDQVTPEDLPDLDVITEGPHEGDFIVGLDERERVQFMEYSKAPNTLIAGAVNSGKSVLMNWFLWQALHMGASVSMIDPHRQIPKDIYQKLVARDQLLHYTIEKSVSDPRMDPDRVQSESSWVGHLKDLENEMEKRQQGQSEVRRTLFVIDEFPSVYDSDNYADAIPIIQRLAQESRKVGIVLLFIVQNPSADVIDSDVRENLTWTLMGNIQNPAQLTKIFPAHGDQIKENVARTLGHPGRFSLVNVNTGELELVQAPYAEHLDVDRKEGW